MTVGQGWGLRARKGKSGLTCHSNHLYKVLTVTHNFDQVYRVLMKGSDGYCRLGKLEAKYREIVISFGRQVPENVVLCGNHAMIWDGSARKALGGQYESWAPPNLNGESQERYRELVQSDDGWYCAAVWPGLHSSQASQCGSLMDSSSLISVENCMWSFIPILIGLSPTGPNVIENDRKQGKNMRVRKLFKWSLHVKSAQA